MKQLKWFGRVFVVLGIALLAIPFFGGTAGADDPAPNAFLKEAHQGATNPGFEEGECPDAGWGWHFVIPDQGSSFVSIKVTFQDAGVITTFNSFPTGMHAYVYTPGPDTLVDAEAVVDGEATEFNLSHVCAGPEETTTTTVEETTTSEVLASTTEQEFTTTTEATTTLPTDVQPAELARTGSNTGTMVSAGLALVLVGGVFMLRSRRFGTR